MQISVLGDAASSLALARWDAKLSFYNSQFDAESHVSEQDGLSGGENRLPQYRQKHDLADEREARGSRY